MKIKQIQKKFEIENLIDRIAFDLQDISFLHYNKDNQFIINWIDNIDIHAFRQVSWYKVVLHKRQSLIQRNYFFDTYEQLIYFINFLLEQESSDSWI